MSEAWQWLEPRIEDAPEALRDRMHAALATSSAGSVHEQLADGAAICLRIALQRPARRASAMDLLSADALLTHACAAAAEAGPDVLAQFTATLDAQQFERIMNEKNG